MGNPSLKLSSSNGYQIKPKQTQRNAKPLKVLPNLNATDKFRFIVNTRQLEKFDRDTACWPRIHKKDADKLRVYRGPLALVKESPGPSRAEGWALICLEDLAYNQSFYGYSAAGHPHGKQLAHYLQLFVHSQTWLHYALLTSAKLGAERPNLYKEDLDECPIIPFDLLTDVQRAEVNRLSKRLIAVYTGGKQYL